MAKDKQLEGVDVESERAIKSAMHNFLRQELGEEFFPKLYSDGPQLPMISDVGSIRSAARQEIQDFEYAMWFAKTYDQPWLRELVWFNLALRVSSRRTGRKEAIEALVGGIEQRVRSAFRLKKAEG